MAANSNRSPSPISSRPINPNPRNSENNSSNRKSFNNNPFPKPSVLTNPKRFDPMTPANSPSDFSRRRSVGKESSMGMGSSLKHCEEKENNNEKEEISKAFKLQSPIKGSKNFMSPTISAASKFTPSPRKKVLVDRNEPVRTSISLCDGKATFFSEIGSNENEIKESYIDSKVIEKKEAGVQEAPPPVPKPSKKVTFSEVITDSHHVSESLSESVITDSDYSLKKMESKDCIAPLDADPSLPPYDPKTNYLSPRPQFLHYKPNPRIEILLNKEKNGEGFKQLEDVFLAEMMSQNFSDSEGTVEEESNTEDSQKLEVSDSADMVLGFDELEENPFVSEPLESLPVSSTVSSAMSDENLVQKKEKKSKFKCVSMLLMVLIIACVSISVTRSLTLDQTVVKDMSFTDLSNFYHQSLVAAYAKVNFDRINEFSFSPMASISKLIDSLGKEEKLVAIQFMNISDLQKDIMNGVKFMDNHLSNELVDNVEEEEEEDELQDDVDTEEEVYEEIGSDESYDNEFDTRDEVFEVEAESPELELENSEIVENQKEVVSDINTETLISENSEDQLAAITLDQEIKFEAESVEVASEITEVEKFNDDKIISSSDFADVSTTTMDHEIPLEVDSSSEGSKSENRVLVIGTSSLFAILAAVGGAFLYKQKKNAPLENVMVQKQNIIYQEKKQQQQQQQFSQNWQTEVDVVGESCPSEMSSSFQKSASSYRTKEVRGEGSETQSWFEKKPLKYSKRESLSSSTSEYSTSPSYGSFTTYEKIPIKNANGDERIITPVRRSSRIRTKDHFSVKV